MIRRPELGHQCIEQGLIRGGIEKCLARRIERRDPAQGEQESYFARTAVEPFRNPPCLANVLFDVVRINVICGLCG